MHETEWAGRRGCYLTSGAADNERASTGARTAAVAV